MTDIRKAVEERHPGVPREFVAGYLAGLERAAQVVEASNSQAVSMEDVAAAIRKIGEDDD